MELALLHSALLRRLTSLLTSLPPRPAEEERCSAAKWSLLQALLKRGLTHLGGCTFRQLPVRQTHVGDELLTVRPLHLFLHTHKLVKCVLLR